MDRTTIIALAILKALLAAEFIWLEVREARQRSKDALLKDALLPASLIPTEHSSDKTTVDKH